MSDESLALTPTGQTIVHRDRKFEIFLTTDHRAESPYVLAPVSKKGSKYFLLRNVKTPSHMFGVSCDSLRNLPGWFSDASGELKSLG